MTVSDPLSGVVGVLLEMARTLESSDGAHERLVHTLELLDQLVSYNRCALLEVLPSGDHEVIAVPEMSADERQRLTKKLTNIFRLITEDEEPAGGNGFVGGGVHLGLPLIAMDNTVGVLFVERDSDEPFGEDSLRLLSLVAAQLGAYLATIQAANALTRSAEYQLLLIERVSHDLRNPLAAITNGAAMLMRRLTDPRDRQVLLERITATADRCARIIADLTNATQVRAPGSVSIAPRSADLGVTIRSLVDEFRLSHPDRTIDFTGSDSPLWGEWDPDRLSQALTNLLSNALRYSPADSHVTVKLVSTDEKATISVHNGGHAIPEATLATIFDRFKQGLKHAARGLGLGLYIVHQIVQAHGGEITGHSTDEDGTTFTMTLPRRLASRQA